MQSDKAKTNSLAIILLIVAIILFAASIVIEFIFARQAILRYEAAYEMAIQIERKVCLIKSDGCEIPNSRIILVPGKNQIVIQLPAFAEIETPKKEKQ